jgi:hypothetical protein
MSTEALDALLTAVYLYGWPGCRGHSGNIRDAIRALSPEAAACIDSHGEGEAWRRFCSTATEEEKDA